MNQQDKILVVFTTCPTSEVSKSIAETLVNEHLAACVNSIPGVSSTYRWKDALHTDSETLLMIKTTEGQLPELKQRIAQLHPYELPELIAIPVCAGAEPYLTWIRQSLAPLT